MDWSEADLADAKRVKAHARQDRGLQWAHQGGRVETIDVVSLCHASGWETRDERPYPSFQTAPPGVSTHSVCPWLMRGPPKLLVRLPGGRWPCRPLLLMLGDNHYADSTDPAIQRAAYMTTVVSLVFET